MSGALAPGQPALLIRDQPLAFSQEMLSFAGYAALFNRRDAGGDTIRAGAFARTLHDRQSGRLGPLPLYWQHRADLRIGWVDTIAEDQRGLRVVATLDNPQGGAAVALGNGAVTGLSIGYRTRRFIGDNKGRELLDLDLFEISLVTHPMQHAARVHLVA